MKKHSWYLFKSQPNGGYHVYKCNEDFEYGGFYTLNQIRKFGWECNCPNTHAKECRHKLMIDIFKKKKAIDKPMFYCYETEEWHKVKEA